MLRVILCSFFSILVIKTATVMIHIFNYVLLRWALDAIQLDIDFTGVQSEIILFVMLWHYLVATVVIIVIWVLFGIPEEIVPEWIIKLLFRRRAL